MKHFFDYDGTLNRILTQVMYVVALNLLFLICSIPIFTIGASAVAMYTVMFRYLREDEPAIVKGFFTAFKENFKKATLLWLVLLAVAVTLAFNFYFLYQGKGFGGAGIQAFMYLVLLFWLMFWVWIFPAMAYFENSVRGYLAFSAGLAFGKLFHTVALALIQTIPVLAVLFLAQYMQMATLLLIFCGVSLPAYCCAGIYLKTFQRYEG